MASVKVRNTFAQGVAGETISVSEIIEGIRYGIIKEESLPRNVHDAVAAEIERRGRETISPSRALIILLGTMGDVRGTTRLQKYAFLVDMNIYSSKSREIYTMYGWKSHKFGPYSTNLEGHIRAAIDEKLVEAFSIPAPDGKTGVGYRLTDTGKAEFEELLESFRDDSMRIKSLLSKFAHDRTVDPLAEFVYSR